MRYVIVLLILLLVHPRFSTFKADTHVPMLPSLKFFDSREMAVFRNALAWHLQFPRGAGTFYPSRSN